MDKLKYIKLENEDGSYSNSIPLAVDSDYVDINGDTLTNVISAKANTIDVNASIADLESEISAVASGSPAGVYDTVAALTTADPDRSKIYVVSADGHWYYYDEGWLDGGTYQAAEDSETVDGMYDYLMINSKNLYDKKQHLVKDYFLGSKGLSYYKGMSYMKYPVVPGEVYYFLNPHAITQNKWDLPGGNYIGYLDSEDNVFSIENIGKIGSDTPPTYLNGVDNFIEITIPENAVYMIINTKLFAYDIEDSAILSKEHPFGYAFGDRDTYLRSLMNIDLYTNLYRYNYNVPSYLIDNIHDEPQSSQTGNYAEIPVDAHKKYVFFRGEKTTARGDAIHYLNSEKQVIANDLIDSLKKDYIEQKGYVFYLDKLPSTCAYIRINSALTNFNAAKKMYFGEYQSNHSIVNSDYKAREEIEDISNIIITNKYPNFETATVIYDEFKNIDLIGNDWQLNAYWDAVAWGGHKYDYANTDMALIKVKPGEYYYIKGKSAEAARLFALQRNNKNILNLTLSQSGNKYSDYIVKIPEECYFMYVNRWHTSEDTYKQSCFQLYKINDFVPYPKNILSNFSKEASLIIKAKPMSSSYYDHRLLAVWLTASTITELNATKGDVLEIQYSLATRYPEIIHGWISNFSITAESPSLFTLLTDTFITSSKANELAGMAYNGEVKNEVIYGGTSGSKYISLMVDIDYEKIKDMPIYIIDPIIVNKTKNTSLVLNASHIASNSAYSTYSGTKITAAGIEGYETSNQFIDTSLGLGFSKWYAIGDSITEKNFRAKTNYFDYCVNDLKITGVNLGRSGTGYKRTENTFITRLDQITTYNYDTDIITVYGSINDNSFVASALGQLGDTTTDTLYGSMYTFFNTLFTKFGAVRVGLITPIPWKGSKDSNDAKLYKQALIDTANLFNVPYLDLEKCTNLRPDDTDFLNTYYMSDNETTPRLDTGGVHPNSIGHKLFYGRIKEFLKTL